MSAFIVEPKTINRVINAARFADVQMGEFDPKSEPEMVGAELYAMNRRAVLARYPGDEEFAATPDWRFNPRDVEPTKTGIIAHLQAIQCLHYQCSEGAVGGEPLYAALELLSVMLVRHLSRLYPPHVSKRDGWFYDVPEWNTARAWA